jgi:choline transporter-like protein 2/4/5
MPTFPVLVAMKNTFIYHVGSVAFGSLIIAILLFIRWGHEAVVAGAPLLD